MRYLQQKNFREGLSKEHRNLKQEGMVQTPVISFEVSSFQLKVHIDPGGHGLPNVSVLFSADQRSGNSTAIVNHQNNKS
jgi:hypothetical protein